MSILAVDAVGRVRAIQPNPDESLDRTSNAERRVAVVGTSGHAKVVIDLIEKSGNFQVACLIDTFKRIGTELFGYRVCGTEDDIPAFFKACVFDCAALAIGDNWTRSQVAGKIREATPDLEFPVLIHPSARIGKDVVIGAGTVIVAGVSVNAGARVGEFCILNTRSSLDRDSAMADFSSLAPASAAGRNVAIGEHSAISIGATVSHAVSVGKNTVVGAGAVVMEDVPSLVTSYGVPARIIRDRAPGDPYLDSNQRSSSAEPNEIAAPGIVTMSDRLTLVRSGSSEWNEYLEGTDHDFYHTSDCHQVSEFAGEGESWLAVYGGKDKHFSWPFLLRKIQAADQGDTGLCDVTSVYGYAGPLFCNSNSDPKFLLSAWQTLVEYWRSRNVVSVFSRFHPLLGNPAVHLTGASEQGRTVAIDVARPMDEIRNDYRRQVRQQLRRCSEVNLKVSHDPGWEHLDDFVRLYYETMIRNRALPYYLFPEEYFRRLRKVLGERGSLMVATFDGEAASIALVIEYRRIVNVHLLGNSERFYKYAPSKMLFDEIAQWAQLRGAHFVHLGGGRGCNSDDPLFRFKAQFSRYSFPFYLAKLILNNEAYEARVAERKHESEAWGVEMTPDFFPAYRSPVQPPRILNETA